MMTHPGGTAMPAVGAARFESVAMPTITGPLASEEGCAADADAVSSKAVLGDDFLNAKELASLIHVDPSTLRRWRNAEPPAGPPFTRLSPGVVVYSAADVRHWISRGRVDPAERA